MVYLKKILITTDLSEHSLAAFEYAFSFGLLYASKIFILYVVDDAPPLFTLYGLEGDTQLHPSRIEEVGAKKLENFILTHVGTDKKVLPVVRSGVPEREILNFAQEEDIDLIVMATHGWTGLRHIVLGSVVEKIVRHSTIPVLTIKPEPLQVPVVRREDVESELHLK